MKNKSFLYLLFVCFSAFWLSACAGDGKKSLSATEIDASYAQLMGQKKAALAVRVIENKRVCEYGTVRLRRIENGVIDRDHYVSIAAIKRNYGFAGFPSSTKMSFNLLNPASFEQAANGLTAQNVIGAYNAIEPGQYIITEVVCGHAGNGRSWVGETQKNWFGFDKMGEAKPVLGANFIEIKANEMVDAGTLELKTLEGKYHNYSVFIMPYAADERLRRVLDMQFPTLSQRITFRTFSWNQDIMRAYFNVRIGELANAQQARAK